MHGLCWWENTNRTKNFIYSSLTLGTWDKMKLMLCALCNCNMGGKIRRLSMNIAFKYIGLKGLNCLTQRSIVYLYIMYQSLYDSDYHIPEIRCALFNSFGLDYEIKKVVLGTSLTYWVNQVESSNGVITQTCLFLIYVPTRIKKSFLNNDHLP